MRNKILTFAIAAALISAAACGCGSSGSPAPAAQEVEDSAEPIATEEVAETPSAQETTETPILEEATVAVSETPTAQEPASDSGSGAPIEGGIHEIDGIQVLYYPDVRNDVTGNWRLGVISDGSDLNTYVVDYFKYFCRSDAEVHGIVNLGLGTTTQISKVSGDTLEITVMEYVDGEEHDAKLLYSGAVLNRYLINMDTLEVEPLE